MTHKTLAIASVPNHLAKFDFLKQAEKQCLKSYNGQVLNKDEIHERNMDKWNYNPALIRPGVTPLKAPR